MKQNDPKPCAIASGSVAKRRAGAVAVLAGLTSSLLLGCGEPDETKALLLALDQNARPKEVAAERKKSSVEINPRLLRRFQALRSRIESPRNPLLAPRVELGRMLYFEKRLSKNQELSCNSCHTLDSYGVDHSVTSTGHKAQKGTRNSPTVYNAAGFFAQFWDGRMETVEQQATGPILNPVEMALSSGEQAVKILKSMPEYPQRFKAAFPEESQPLTFANVGIAIGAFERQLTTPSRWDDYLRGDESALTDPEREGLRLFTNVGCMVCHTGEFVGGAMYQKVGVVEPWPNQKDQGRFEVTKQEVDRMMFKVPTLRNVAETGPYFHDGSVAKLDDAVRLMGRHQLGLSLSDREVGSIVTWLRSLTGRLPSELIQPPALPPSTPTTPGPNVD